MNMKGQKALTVTEGSSLWELWAKGKAANRFGAAARGCSQITKCNLAGVRGANPFYGWLVVAGYYSGAHVPFLFVGWALASEMWRVVKIYVQFLSQISRDTQCLVVAGLGERGRRVGRWKVVSAKRACLEVGRHWIVSLKNSMLSA